MKEAIAYWSDHAGSVLLIAALSCMLTESIAKGNAGWSAAIMALVLIISAAYAARLALESGWLA